MRGKVLAGMPTLFSNRITPAYAGKSYDGFSSGSLVQDHPRVCGEKVLLSDFKHAADGSPPRMRGKAVGENLMPEYDGITPAYAGKR